MVAPKSEQNSLRKLGAPVRDHVNQDAVEPDDVGQQQLGSLFLANGSLGNGMKWAILLKHQYNHRQYGDVATGRWQTGLPGKRSPGLAGELGAVGPLQNLRPEVRWHEQTIGRTQAQTGLVLDGFNFLIHLPGECGDQTGGWKDGIRSDRVPFLLWEVPGQGVRLDVVFLMLYQVNQVRKSDQRACREFRRANWI